MNKTVISTENYDIDIDENGTKDFKITTEFMSNNGSFLSIDSRFAIDKDLIDVSCTFRDTDYVNDLKYYNKDIEIGPSISWFGSSQYVANVLMYFCQWVDGSSFGINIVKKRGPFDLGDKYMIFKINSTYDNVKGWRYGWINFNTTKDKFTIVDYAFHKKINSINKTGEL